MHKSNSREFTPSFNAASKDSIVFSGSFVGEPLWPHIKNTSSLHNFFLNLQGMKNSFIQRYAIFILFSLNLLF
jgi:hypothetical protein